MAIIKDTIHPQNSPQDDIYPKTSVDQVDELPNALQEIQENIQNVQNDLNNVNQSVELLDQQFNLFRLNPYLFAHHIRIETENALIRFIVYSRRQSPYLNYSYMIEDIFTSHNYNNLARYNTSANITVSSHYGYGSLSLETNALSYYVVAGNNQNIQFYDGATDTSRILVFTDNVTGV